MPDDIVTEFIRRLVALDFKGAAEPVSGDLEYDNVPVGKNHGREAFLGFVTAMMNGFDELEFIHASSDGHRRHSDK
jgi:limonene-1,2-epoxide hydrolase